MFFFFFFQAEDGIRDVAVTGVQTCALPIYFSFSTLPFLAGIALLPIRIALLEWFRKSELSSDRAGLLAVQDPHAAMRMHLKMAGGGDMKQKNLDAFLVQAKEYEESGGGLDP